jgi:hypothetical protein
MIPPTSVFILIPVLELYRHYNPLHLFQHKQSGGSPDFAVKRSISITEISGEPIWDDFLHTHKDKSGSAISIENTNRFVRRGVFDSSGPLVVWELGQDHSRLQDR